MCQVVNKFIWYIGNCWFLASIGALTFQKFILQQVVPLDQRFDEEYSGIFHFKVHQRIMFTSVSFFFQMLLLPMQLLFNLMSPNLVLEIWKMGGRHHWRQAANNKWPTDLCSLQRSNWVLACSAGESLCKVCKKQFILCELWHISKGSVANFTPISVRVCGSYSDMNAGTPSEALVDFTGGVHMCVQLSDPPANLWELMCRAGQSKSLMGCGTPQGASSSVISDHFSQSVKSSSKLYIK